MSSSQLGVNGVLDTCKKVVQSERFLFICEKNDKSSQKPQRLREFRAQFAVFSSCLERPCHASCSKSLSEDIR